MKRFLVAVVCAAFLACTAIESSVVASNEIVTAEGDAVAVIQSTALGLTLFWHYVKLVDADMDKVVNKLLIAEAKSMGANKVELTSAQVFPTTGLFRLLGAITPINLVGLTYATATGVAVK